MRIAVFGGSFNPPHIGHIEAAKAAVLQLEASRLLVIPAYSAPLKETTEGSPDAEARLKMAREAFSDMACAEVLDVEIRRGGVSYTVDTLEKLKEEYPGDELCLMLGTDQISQFEKWRSFRRILELATLAPFPRKPEQVEAVSEATRQLEKKYNAKIEQIRLVPTDISSTALRQLLPKRQGSEYLAPQVYAQIIKHRYYGAKPEFSWLRLQSQTYLDPKRIPHVLGCEQEAVRLAKRWGADEQDCAEAAILHDITKKLKADDQLKLCEQYDIMTDADEKANYKLLHSKTGAALSRDLFGISDEVYSAIFWHTTAKENMTLLEKIIYMADYIEPNRRFEGVERLRALAYENLNEAIILGLEMSLSELSKHDAKPHINSLKAMDWLREHK